MVQNTKNINRQISARSQVWGAASALAHVVDAGVRELSDLLDEVEDEEAGVREILSQLEMERTHARSAPDPTLSQQELQRTEQMLDRQRSLAETMRRHYETELGRWNRRIEIRWDSFKTELSKLWEVEPDPRNPAMDGLIPVRLLERE